MRAPIVINSKCIEAIFDSGAGISVISKTLADKLKLKPTTDSLQLSSLDETIGPPCKIVTNVPIRVAGKHRPEHTAQTAKNPQHFLLGNSYSQTWTL
ncbi:hypothetical protein INT45_001608 [Circinella minor]|uniref:Uncharacterized protein n=1 Tax=Circinella minor TaxID=1195481 RepID=A0A8H7RSH3_9FUNG|nr:hypothetical protein INT45_001608 [Circinella minor]